MDDFSHTGAYDALGSFSRAQIYVNAFTLEDGLPTGDLIPPEQRGEVFKKIAAPAAGQALPRRLRGGRAGRVQRVLRRASSEELDCNEAHRATGPIP